MDTDRGWGSVRRWTLGRWIVGAALVVPIATSSGTSTLAAPGDGSVTVRVVQEFNGDGEWDTLVEPGMEGVTVRLVDDSGGAFTTTTDVDGLAVFDVATLALTGGQYRVEVDNPDPELYRPSVASEADPTDTPSATRLSSTEEFVDVADDTDVTVTVGFMIPDEFCQSNPLIVNACQQSIYLNNGNLNTDDTRPTLFTAPYRGRGTNVGVTNLATLADTGSVYGIGYHKVDRRIFSGAYAKRAIAYGPGGQGAIYVTDRDTGTTSLWGVVPDAGTTPHSFLEDDRFDWDFNYAVGKESLGDLDISEDGDHLQVINLNNRTLYVYDATAATMGDPLHTVDLSSAYEGCADVDDWRPAALGERHGVLYVGGVCSAESTGDQDDLRAIVLTFDAETYTQTGTVMDQPMHIKRQFNGMPCDPADDENPRGDYWYPWGVAFDCTNTTGWVNNPRPLLLDIVIENNGDLVVAFRDIYSDQQLGVNSPNFDPDTDAYLGLSKPSVSGDVNKACPDEQGMFVLDFNGACGIDAVPLGEITGEFFTGDAGAYGGPGSGHPESAYAGIALSRGERGIVANFVDANGQFETGGYARVDRFTGTGVETIGDSTGPDPDEFLSFDPNEVAGERSQHSRPGENNGGNRIAGADSFQKGAGLADIEVLCDLAPVQIGNRIWYDADGDGIQDPGEGPAPGVTVNLYDAEGNLVATTVTNDRGEYYFDTVNDDIDYGTNYVIRLDEPTDYEPGGPLDPATWQPTAANQGDDRVDSDGVVVGGFSEIAITVGQPGDVDHTHDFGFAPLQPGIDLVKFDGRATPPADPVDGADPVNGSYDGPTPGSWPPAVDADTPDQAVVYPVNNSGSTGPQPVGIIVTNTGGLPLADVSVADLTHTAPAVTGLSCNFAPLGGPGSGTTWAGPLLPGDSFRCNGTLTLQAGQTHANSASVTALPADPLTGEPVPGTATVGDEDRYHAATSYTPALEITKRDQASGAEADTAGQAVVFQPGETRTVEIPVTNSGNAPLTRVTVTDTLIAGPPMTDLSCTFPDGSVVAASNAGAVVWAASHAGNNPAQWLPGVTFTCTGELTMQAGAAPHADNVAVVAVAPTGEELTDDDPFHARTTPLATTTSTTTTIAVGPPITTPLTPPTSTPGGVLPDTGSNGAALMWTGLVALLGGFALVAAARRRLA
ncbi:MAG TPA: SdrD B-like domain-containing protein [Ilumatobacter sp.]|nr:SdrD B-like domain-containing protein [Ilumatobacter sp.]